MAEGIREHFIPASVIGRFSFAPRPRRRDSPVHVLHLRTDRPYRRTAKTVGYIVDFYEHPFETEDGAPEFDAEKAWQGFERSLPGVLDELQRDPTDLSADTWANVLVPYVTSTLVRTPEFRDRHKRRTPWLRDVEGMDEEGNAARVAWLELQRLLAQVMTSKWTILVPAGESGFVLNDRGWFAGRLDGRQTPGIIVPFGPRAAIQVVPAVDRVIAFARGIRWVASDISTRLLSDDETSELNRCSAEWAAEEIYGPDENQLTSLKKSLASGPWWTDTSALGFLSGRVLIPTDFDWYRFATLSRCLPGTVPFPPPAIPSSLIGDLPFRPPVFIIVEKLPLSSGLHIGPRAVRLRLFLEAFLVTPGLESLDKVRWASMLDALVLKHGIAHLKDAEDEFYLHPGVPPRPAGTDHTGLLGRWGHVAAQCPLMGQNQDFADSLGMP